MTNARETVRSPELNIVLLAERRLPNSPGKSFSGSVKPRWKTSGTIHGSIADEGDMQQSCRGESVDWVLLGAICRWRLTASAEVNTALADSPSDLSSMEA